MRQLEALLTEIAPRLPRQLRLDCKRFFSGGAVYADGRIFMTLTTVGLALKLPEDARMTLLREGGKPLRYFANGNIKKEYVVVPEALAGRPSALWPWIEQSILYVTQ